MDSNLTVHPMDASTARTLVEEHHYLHRKPQVMNAFGLYRDSDPVGVVTLGVPASRHMMIGACPSDPSLVLELNRLWVSDEMPANTESWFVSRALKQMPPRLVLSYADTRQGHMGYVYRALNFRYAGWTDMERKTPRPDYIPATGGHTREAFRSGYVEKVRRSPKVKYWTVTGKPAERRKIAKMCQWPSLNWHQIPPPTEHQQYLLAAA